MNRYSLIALIMATAPSFMMAGSIDFKDWTPNGPNSLTNTSAAGTITVTGSFGAPGGPWGVANAIDPPGPIVFSTEINTAGVGTGLNLTFSTNYVWGTGGYLILGNIHEYFQYTLSAWDFSNNPIDVNTWSFLGEFLHGSPGQSGYFSTSSTSHCAGGSAVNAPPGQSVCPGTSDSENFYVYDTAVDPNSGQGGVVLLGGLTNVGRISLTLASNSLAPNGQGGDFIIFNVGTPTATPEPSSMALIFGGVTTILALRRRRAARAA